MQTEEEIKLSYHRLKHGSLYDRGSADAYYWRDADPHYYPNGTYNPPRIGKEELSKEQIVEYMFAYNNETERKEYQ